MAMKVATPFRQISAGAEPLGIPYNPYVPKTALTRSNAAKKKATFLQQSFIYNEPAPLDTGLRNKPAPLVARNEYSVPNERAINTETLLPLQHDRRHHEVEARPVNQASLSEIKSQGEGPEDDLVENQGIAHVRVDDIGQTPWQEYEIPDELGILQPDVPEDLRNIVQESLDEQRAMRLSKLHMPGSTSSEISIGDYEQWAKEELLVAESSAMANRRSQLSSRGPQTDSIHPLSDSMTRLESDGSSQTLLKPTKVESNPASRDSEETQYSELKVANRRLQKNREKTSRAHGLFRKLRRAKDASPVVESQQEIETHECTSCFDEIANQKAVTVPCRHQYCIPCFSQLITTALENENHFPPKCCLQEIPRLVLRKHLQSTDLAAFDIKALEYSVAIGSRYYCARPECAKWIDTTKARSRNGTLECPHCRHSMCTFCRGPVHPADQDCPQDFGLDATLRQAERAGWQRCYSCRALVELNTGCRHITCKCKAEFCYTCGAQWRTCACTEDDQARRTLQIRENLAKQEAEAQAEEEEIRAAIAAVEEAERQAAEERRERERQEEEARAEEARQIAVREFERVEKINQKFDRLRKILIHIHSQQSEVLTQRHAKQMKEIETKETELEATFAESKDIQKDRARIVSETESQIQELRKKHTAQLIQTRSRHRKDEDDCLLIFSGETEGNHTPDPGSILEALLSAQELERVTLRNIQAREVSKCKDRGDMSLWFFDERVRREGEDRKGRYERRRADLVEEVKGLKRGQWADWKWMELVKGERTRMLGEDEWRVILGGGEVGGKEGGKEEVDLWWLGS